MALQKAENEGNKIAKQEISKDFKKEENVKFEKLRVNLLKARQMMNLDLKKKSVGF